MRKLIILLLLVLGLTVSSSATVKALAVAVGEELLKPDQVVKHLLEGNSRFIKQQLTTSLENWGKPVAEPLRGPCAVILTCADAAIPPEILFDKGAGCLFVLRVAGNIINPGIIGSIEYAVEQLGIPLVMILGHERCGVVSAAVAAKGNGLGNYGSLLKTLEPAIRQATMDNPAAATPELVELTIDLNAKMVASSLPERSSVLKRLMDKGQVKIVAAKLDGAKGKVSLLE